MQTTPSPGERLLHETTSLCRVCKNGLLAQVVALDSGEVWMKKRCPAHGSQEVRLSTDAAWYERNRAVVPRLAPPRAKKAVERGCPFDCGACESHQQKVRLPVVTITSACNLDCPICYVHNKNEDAYHMPIDSFRGVVARLVEEHGELDLLNLTGGDPTMHPQLLELLAVAQEAGVHRPSICTNGLKFAHDEELVRKLSGLRARVALSFDSFKEGADFVMQGAKLLPTKLRVLDLLEEYDIDTTLIPVMTRGINDDEIGALIRLALGRRNIRHIEVHTITYTGQGGVNFPRRGRISLNEVLARIEETTEGALCVDDFVPSPCAHPLCYQIAYLLVDPDGGESIPFTRFLSRETLYDLLSDRLYLEPSAKFEEAVREAIDRLWSEGGDEDEHTLGLLKRMLSEMTPAGRSLSRDEALRVGERFVKAVYLHSHMDEETFDTERAALCCSSNCYADGTTIPVCNYNVLYREQEAQFMKSPAGWGARDGGTRRPLALKVLG
jgi:hypothetical protein